MRATIATTGDASARTTASSSGTVLPTQNPPPPGALRARLRTLPGLGRGRPLGGAQIRASRLWRWGLEFGHPLDEARDDAPVLSVGFGLPVQAALQVLYLGAQNLDQLH